MVVYDRASQQLQLQDANQSDEELHLPRLCPYCHRPFQDDNESDLGDEHGGRAPTATGYVDPNYFAMLDSSQSPPASRPGSSGNRLMPYVVDEREEDRNNAVNSLTSAGISPQSFNDGFFKRNFIEERVLGKGGKGIVLLVKHVLGSNDLGQFACKRVPVGDSPEWLRKVLVEVQTLKKLSHHNLAPYHHAWLERAKVSSFGPTVPCVFILQRYCEAGDLHRYVCGPTQSQSSPQELKARMRRRSRGEPDPPSGLSGGPRRLQIETIYSLFKDITNGLRYLHKKNLIHRDLKPSNCLLTMEANKLQAVVSDFGEVQSEDAVRASTGSTGTVSYCAPEVLQRVGPQGPYGNFTYKSDIFSLGMVLYFLCFGTLPYIHADVNDEDNEDLDQLRDEVCHWSGFDDAQRLRPELPDKVYWLLARLLSQSPEKRPTCKEIFDLMKKHNNWDIATADRRPSINPAIEMPPEVSPTHPDRSDSASATSHRGSISPRLEKSTPKRSPEPDGHTGSAAATTTTTTTTGRDYGTLKSGPDDSRPEERGEDHSLVLSRNGHSDAPDQRNHDYCYGHHPDFISRRLLAAVPFSGRCLQIFRSRPVMADLVAFAVFLLKIVSITIPCTPHAARPSIFYSLLVLATVDLGVVSISFHVFALVGHALAVGLAGRLETLCVGA